MLGFQELVYDQDIPFPKGIPLSNSLIDKIPNIKIDKLYLENKDKTCSICMEEFKIGENVKILGCEHYFHKDCVVKWLKTDNTCPNCRTIVTK